MINQNIELLEFLQNNYLNSVIGCKYCSNNIYENYAYKSVSGTLLLKFVFRKIINKVFGIYDDRESKKYKESIEKVISTINKNEKAIIVFAPFFDSGKDGYIERIKTIDSSILNDYYKIYLNCTGAAKKEFLVQEKDKKHIYITFNSFDDEQLREIIKLIKKVKKTYTHSIHMFMPDDVSTNLLKIFADDEINNTIDMHGVVPEELEMQNMDNRAYLASMLENYIINNADKIICVTNVLKDYLISKYKLNNDKFEVLPVYNNDIIDIDEIVIRKEKRDKPLVIYSGGLQKWQNIELMNRIIKNTTDKYDYEIYVSDPKEYKKTLDDETIKKIKIDTKSQEEMKDVYLRADYGFVLRDDNIVNNVACPTKLIDYLRYGIIPIIKTNKIGFLIDNDVFYVREDDFLRNCVPNNISRMRVIENNFKIVENMSKVYGE